MKIIRTLSLMLMAIMLGSPFAAAASPTPPKVVIQQSLDGIIKVLNERKDKTKLSGEDRAQIRKVLNNRFDYSEMAKRSLGSPWRSLDAAKRKHFTELFQNMLERSYGNRLAKEYHNQQMVIADPVEKNDKVKIGVDAVDDQKTIPMEFYLYQTSDGWQVYNIVIENVSLISTFRADFKAQVEKDGVDGLIKSLEEKVAKLASEEG